jgi:hypothetical protein
VIGYGSGVSATTDNPSNPVALIVKYDGNGNAQWAKTSSGGGASTRAGFLSAAVDLSGNVYAVGYQSNGNTFNYGGAGATGAFSGTNVAIVKYDSTTGAALLAKSTTSAPAASYFYGVAADGSGNVYAVGWQAKNGIFNYGVSATAQGNFNGANYGNAVIVHYDSSLIAQWAQSTTAAPAASAFYGVETDGQGNVYAAGYQSNTGTFNYGGASYFNGIAAGYQSGVGTFNYGGASAQGGYSGSYNAAAVGWR